MNYIKLLNFELSRFIKIYFVLIFLTIISQLISTYSVANTYMNQFNLAVYRDGISIEQYVEQFGQISLMDLQNSGLYNLPIVVAAVTLLLYCFFIWYRDWLGKNTFIYRLLMLPTARINIYLSKATAIFLMVLGLVALQVILLLIEAKILKWMVPANLRHDYSIMEYLANTVGDLYLGVLIPMNFIQFLIHYGIGFMFVFVLFTSILFERCFKWRGIILGVAYALVSMSIFFIPFILEIIFAKRYLYPMELFVVEIVLGLIVTAMSIWIAHYLLNRKITV